MTRVTAVIPTHNRADLLGEAVESALMQTGVDVEVIVVDDGSTDHTHEVVSHFGDRVRFIVQENLTEGPARNQGIRHATGDIVAFLDSDDRWLRGKLSRDVKCFEDSPDIGFVYSNVRYISHEGNVIGIRSTPSPSGSVLEKIVLDNFVVASTAAARRIVFESVGVFSERRELSGSMDWEMWMRIASRFPFGYVDEVGTEIRVHSSNMMCNPVRMQQSMLNALEVCMDSPDLGAAVGHLRAQAYGHAYTYIAINYYASGEMKTARHYLHLAAKVFPQAKRRPIWWYTYARTLCGKSLSRLVRGFKQGLRQRTAGEPRVNAPS